MTGVSAAAALPYPLPAEDRVRADLYALVARLFAAPPDAAFLTALAEAPELPESAESSLAVTYNALLRASRAMDADAAGQEYTDLFIGVGKCAVNLHASHWLSGFMMDKPLADLRGELAELGIERRDDSDLLEDHLAALAEVMRLLIAGGEGRAPAPLTIQRRFFQSRIAPWAFECCNAIASCPLANYYRPASQFAKVLLAIERDSIAMD